MFNEVNMSDLKYYLESMKSKLEISNVSKIKGLYMITFQVEVPISYRREFFVFRRYFDSDLQLCDNDYYNSIDERFIGELTQELVTKERIRIVLGKYRRGE